MIKISITHFTRSQLKSISDYYTKNGNNSYAESLRKEFLTSIKSLISNPKQGQKESTIKNSKYNYRYLIIKQHYKAIYRQKVNVIYIVDLFDTRQMPEKINRNT